MRRWTHGHTALVAFLAGSVVLGHTWLLAILLVVAFTGGVVLGRLWLQARRLTLRATEVAGTQLEAAGELARARVETERQRARELGSRVELRLRRRDEQEAELRRAYINGATDQLHQLEPGK
jgi:hypothetical protein